ncbi:hypothetical protein CXG81DRAFT_19855 [Caulochytrium protostelioides]|uniref:Uncharacterized protein n=1 Tax=Caulochytrium protostelioides TaxID=1555241 RepID=A0A4P9X574_9FUNG|nr:hypothetical protein CXG81DRAFT_19855 [Caulochytrium protostelioides]|eukprot:RKP00160.1 hypothetical protein CXG81DRAFT_19855 [Caulochytrium protostelioides]
MTTAAKPIPHDDAAGAVLRSAAAMESVLAASSRVEASLSRIPLPLAQAQTHLQNGPLRDALFQFLDIGIGAHEPVAAAAATAAALSDDGAVMIEAALAMPPAPLPLPFVAGEGWSPAVQAPIQIVMELYRETHHRLAQALGQQWQRRRQLFLQQHQMLPHPSHAAADAADAAGTDAVTRGLLALDQGFQQHLHQQLARLQFQALQRAYDIMQTALASADVARGRIGAARASHAYPPYAGFPGLAPPGAGAGAHPDGDTAGPTPDMSDLSHSRGHGHGLAGPMMPLGHAEPRLDGLSGLDGFDGRSPKDIFPKDALDPWAAAMAREATHVLKTVPDVDLNSVPPAHHPHPHHDHHHAAAAAAATAAAMLVKHDDGAVPAELPWSDCTIGAGAVTAAVAGSTPSGVSPADADAVLAVATASAIAVAPATAAANRPVTVAATSAAAAGVESPSGAHGGAGTPGFTGLAASSADQSMSDLDAMLGRGETEESRTRSASSRSADAVASHAASSRGTPGPLDQAPATNYLSLLHGHAASQILHGADDLDGPPVADAALAAMLPSVAVFGAMGGLPDGAHGGPPPSVTAAAAAAVAAAAAAATIHGGAIPPHGLGSRGGGSGHKRVDAWAPAAATASTPSAVSEIGMPRQTRAHSDALLQLAGGTARYAGLDDGAHGAHGPMALALAAGRADAAASTQILAQPRIHTWFKEAGKASHLPPSKAL